MLCQVYSLSLIHIYQWVALPLALHGVVAKKDGTVISVNVGEDPADPVVYVTDLFLLRQEDGFLREYPDSHLQQRPIPSSPVSYTHLFF